MTLHDFDRWMRQNHPNEKRVFDLLYEYSVYKNAPTNKLLVDCPWVKNKDDFWGRLLFSKEEIKDLIEHDYKIHVIYEINRDNHYKCQCLDYDYYLYIQIYLGDRIALELYKKDSEPLDEFVEPFYPFVKENGPVYVYEES